MKNLSQTLKFFYIYAKPYRWQFLFGILALLAVDLLNVFPPLVLKGFVDQVSKTIAGDKRFIPFLWLGLIYAGIALGQGVSRYLWRMFLLQGSFKAAENLRDEYFKKLQKLPTEFYNRNSIGDLMSLATNDVEAVRFALGPGILVFADAVFFVLFIPPAMFWLSPKLAIVSLAPMMIVPFIITYAEKLIHHRFNQVQEQFSKLSSFAQENLEGIRIVKAFVREWSQIIRFSKIGKEFVRLNLRLTKVQSIFEPLFILAVALGLVLLFIFSGPDVMAGVVGLGTFVAFTRYLEQLVWPMMAFGLSVTYYERGKSSLERILRVMNEKEEPKVTNGPDQRDDHRLSNSQVLDLLEARNLTFYYPGQKQPALKNVSFRVAKGSRTALVGTVGSGKSTIVRLITGLCDAPPGTLFWNGADVTRIPLQIRREKIAVVPQDVFLFLETLRWNVLLGTRQNSFPDDKELYETLKRAGLERELQDWQLGMLLGERGLNLSGGQRTRVALGRALIRNASLLILDDALSSVDAHTESQILDYLSPTASDDSQERINNNDVNKDQSRYEAQAGSIRNSMNSQTSSGTGAPAPESRGTHGRQSVELQTLLMVTHRFSRLWKFDQILVLKDGEIVQMGSPLELASTPGLYQQLLELQRMENELAR